MHTYIHTYIHIYIHTYIHTVYIYSRTCIYTVSHSGTRNVTLSHVHARTYTFNSSIAAINAFRECVYNADAINIIN